MISACSRQFKGRLAYNLGAQYDMPEPVMLPGCVFVVRLVIGERDSTGMVDLLQKQGLPTKGVFGHESTSD